MACWRGGREWAARRKLLEIGRGGAVQRAEGREREGRCSSLEKRYGIGDDLHARAPTPIPYASRLEWTHHDAPSVDDIAKGLKRNAGPTPQKIKKTTRRVKKTKIKPADPSEAMKLLVQAVTSQGTSSAHQHQALSF